MSAPAPGARLTLISDLEDVQLQRVCDALDRTAYTRVSGRRAVRLLVEHHVDAPPAERTLDLVGHTCPDGLLLLGDWHLTEDAAAYFARLSDPLVALGVTRVRLLGCSTATTERGWRVLCALAGAVHVARMLGPGHTIVTILCDYGTRYASKLFNPAFLREKNLPVPAWLEKPVTIDKQLV